MIGLFLAELARAFSRRILKIILLGAALLVLVVAVVVFFRTEDPKTAAERAPARYEAAVSECVDSFLNGPPQFDDRGRSVPTSAPPDVSPEERSRAQAECRQHVSMAGQERTFDLMDLWSTDGSDSPLLVVLGFSFLLSFLMGASFIGAEWRAGNMTTTLLWESRRIRLGVAKYFAAVVVNVVGTIAMALIVVVVFLPVAMAHGSTDIDGAWVTDLLRGFGAGLVVVAFWSLLGASIGMVGRNTAAALGVGFVYNVILEGIIVGLRPGWSDWFIGPNVATVMGAGPPEGTNSVARSLLVLTIYGLVAAAASLAIFRRRDIAGTS